FYDFLGWPFLWRSCLWSYLDFVSDHAGSAWIALVRLALQNNRSLLQQIYWLQFLLAPWEIPMSSRQVSSYNPNGDKPIALGDSLECLLCTWHDHYLGNDQ